MATVGAITMDCLDVAVMSGFWSKLLQRPIAEGANQWFAAIGDAHRPGPEPSFLFLATPERAEGKNQVHLDLLDPSYPAEVERAIELGARKVREFAEFGVVWTTLRDPEGNLFDIADAGH